MHMLRWIVIGSLLLAGIAPTTSFAAPTLYRVYQKTKALKEFPEKDQAIRYAKKFSYAIVERIATRDIVWHQIPRYIVTYTVSDQPLWASRSFLTQQQALRFAKKHPSAVIRDTTREGWLWHNIAPPGYQVFQNTKRLPQGHFPTLKKAIAEGKKWSSAHIIDLSTNEWVWDNIPGYAPKNAPAKLYVAEKGKKTLTQLTTLKAAIQAASKTAEAVVRSATDQTVVYRNHRPYIVQKTNGTQLAAFAHILKAIAYAKPRKNVLITDGVQERWSSVPYYHVMQSGRRIAAHHKATQAIATAKKFKKATVVTAHGGKIWSNDDTLIVLGWHGSAKHETIIDHIRNTRGLDWSSPTWFSLANASGALNDRSDPQTVRWLKQKGMRILPLVHNQFDAALTSAFLADDAAQQRFIQTIIAKLVALKVDGINIDFETLAGKDRDLFTDFVRKITEKAKKHRLIVTIDLPRGDVAWNAKTAFDRVALASIVDYIIIMAYDQFYRSSTRPGPVAALNWTEEGIQQYLDEGIPRHKLFLGIPFYARWFATNAQQQVVQTKAIILSDIDRLIRSTQAVVTADPAVGLPQVRWTQDGLNYVFWKEDAASVLQRIALAQQYDLAGVAVWRLGYESATLWDDIVSHTTTRK